MVSRYARQTYCGLTRHASVCNTLHKRSIISIIDVKKTTTWGESGFPSEFLGNDPTLRASTRGGKKVRVYRKTPQGNQEIATLTPKEILNISTEMDLGEPEDTERVLTIYREPVSGIPKLALELRITLVAGHRGSGVDRSRRSTGDYWKTGTHDRKQYRRWWNRAS